MMKPEMSMEIEIEGREQEDDYSEMAPKGRFSAKALNNLVMATNRLLPLFEQTPDYPKFSQDITEFPSDFMKVLSMFKGAVDDAVANGVVDEQYAFDMEGITGDGNVQVLAGKINKLATDKGFKRYLQQQPTEEPQGEEMASAGEEMMKGEAPSSEQIDELFMGRM